MLHSYKSFLLTESRENKIEKQKEKIRKFLKSEYIIDYVFILVVSDEGTKGLKYTTWFCDRIAKDVAIYLSENCKGWEIDQNILKNWDINFFENLLKNGNYEDYKKYNLKTKIRNALTFYNRDSKINTILDWLNSPIRDEEVNLSDYKTIDEAYKKSEEWHKNLKASGIIQHEEGTILMTFEDGYYWIDLETSSSREEADAMGHCGTTHYGNTLYSLRKKQSPHVTIAIDDDTIYQMKGRNNKKPVDKYHPYIIELLSYPNVSENVTIKEEFSQITNFSTTEYNPSEDFHISDLSGEQIIKLKEKNPELINNAGLDVKYKLYKDKLLTAEELIKGYKDLSIIDDKIHFILDGWEDFDADRIFKKERNYINWQKKVLNNEYYEDLNYHGDIHFWDNNNLSDVKEYLLKELLDKCTHDGYKIQYNGESFMMSSENMEISPKKDDICIKSPIGGVISLDSLIRKGEYEANTSEGFVDFECDDLDEIKDAFDRGYCNSQALADEGEAYDLVINSICNTIGKIIHEPGNEKSTWWKTDNKIHIDLKIGYIADLLNQLGDSNYTEIIDIINDIPNCEDPDEFYIECNTPYYGFSGTIDKDTLSEEISNAFY